MTSYAGLDVSQQETHVCVISKDGEILHEGRCATEPEAIAALLAQWAPALRRAALGISGTAPQVSIFIFIFQ